MSTHNFDKELNIIKQIALNNGFQPNLIDKLINKKQYKKAIELVYPFTKLSNKNNFHSITYFGKPSNNIAKYLRKRNLNISFKTNNSLGKYIKNNKSKTSKDCKSGVYRLNCGSCDKVYVGQTGRAFKTRIHEHRKCFLNKNYTSNYASHLLRNDHVFNNNYKILHYHNKSRKLNLLESLEINKLKNSDLLLNDQLDLNNSPLLNL